MVEEIWGKGAGVLEEMREEEDWGGNDFLGKGSCILSIL